jgi:hypothetical protein
MSVVLIGCTQGDPCTALFSFPKCTGLANAIPAPVPSPGPQMLFATYTGDFVAGTQVPPIAFTALRQAATVAVTGLPANPTAGQPYTFTTQGSCVVLAQQQAAGVVAISSQSGTCTITVTDTLGHSSAFVARVP